VQKKIVYIHQSTDNLLGCVEPNFSADKNMTRCSSRLYQEMSVCSSWGQQFSLCGKLQKLFCRLELKSQGVTLVSESFCPDGTVHLHIQLNDN